MQTTESMDPAGISSLGNCSMPQATRTCQNLWNDTCWNWNVHTNDSVYITEFTFFDFFLQFRGHGSVGFDAVGLGDFGAVEVLQYKPTTWTISRKANSVSINCLI